MGPDGTPLTWASVDSKESRMAACRQLSNSLARVAREAPEVTFVALEGDANADARALSAELGVKHYPTVQYWRDGELLWQHEGAGSSAEALQEGALFYAGSAGGGAKVSDYISEVHSPAELDAFLASCSAPAEAVRGMTLAAPCDQQLAVVDVSLLAGSPGCVHIFPAVLALSKNLAGAVRFARVLGDSGPNAKAVMDDLGVSAVPTFVFFADGKEVGRYAGADRGALMSAVLDVQSKVGFQLPAPPTRKRPTIAEAKRIAAEARARDKAAGRQSGW
jgi:thiol-disulfide isomerase/thioredoxin